MHLSLAMLPKGTARFSYLHRLTFAAHLQMRRAG